MGVITREASFDGPNGRVFGELYLPDDPTQPQAGNQALGCVICSHGFNSTHASPARYGKRIVEAGLGYCAFALDFCGGSALSRSEGSVLEHSILTEKADLLAAIDMVRALPEVNPSRIVLEGHSQGGLVSALAAADRPAEISALMLLYPAFMIPAAVRHKAASFDQIPDRGEALGMEIGRRYLVDAWDVDSFAACSYPGPTIIFQGTEDEIVPADDSRRAAELYPQAELVMLEGEGHGFSEEGQDTVFGHMAAFLARL